MYEILTITQSVVFVNTGYNVDWLMDKMHNHMDHLVSFIHENMDLNTIVITTREFRSASSYVLITTYHFSRDIDILADYSSCKLRYSNKSKKLLVSN